MTADQSTTDHTPARKLQKRDWWCMVGLMVLVLGLFLPALHFEFLNWDDNEYIAYNPWIRNLSWENVRGVFLQPYFVNYHPLTMLVYMVVYYNFGGAPEAFRLVNFLLHNASTALLFALFRALGSRRDAALAFAAIFAVHPLRVESVVWISELKDVLCGFFYLLSVYCWIRGEGGQSSLNRWHPAAAVSCITAMLAKSMATTIPAILILHDFIFARNHLVKRLPLHLFLLLLSIGCMKMNLAAQQGAISNTISRSSAVGMAVYAPVHYLAKTLVPVGLCPLYSMDERPSKNPVAVGLGVLLCAGSLFLVFRCFRPRPIVSFALLASAIALAPVSMIIPFGQAWAADRYSYIPTALLLCAPALLSSDFLNTHPARERAFRAGSILLCLVLAGMMLKYQPAWRNNQSVADRILKYFPEESAALINKKHDRIVVKADKARTPAGGEEPGDLPLAAQGGHANAAAGLNATQLIRDGRIDEGLAAMRAMKNRAYGLSLSSRHADDLGRGAEAVQDARALVEIGEKGGARQRELAQAARILAKHGDLATAAAVIDSLDVPVHGLDEAAGMLANEYLARGDMQRAEKYGRRGVRVFPANRRAISALGNVLIVQKRFDEAESAIRRALRHPEISVLGTRYCESALGRIAAQQGDAATAGRHFQRAFAIEDPSILLPDDWYYLGTLADQSRQYPVAELFYRNTLAANPQHRDALINLPYILMQLGKLDEAVELLEKAAEAYPTDTAIAKNLALAREARDKAAAGGTSGS